MSKHSCWYVHVNPQGSTIWFNATSSSTFVASAVSGVSYETTILLVFVGGDFGPKANCSEHACTSTRIGRPVFSFSVAKTLPSGVLLNWNEMGVDQLIEVGLPFAVLAGNNKSATS
jgi:hypothetical protein